MSEFANLKELRKESFMNFNFNNTNTVKLVLPSSVESIGDNAFESS
ncbi:MAG: hypothetical protein MJ233_04080 [Mycoplasmoidaceae bacterium]|nr:hypothetical protein [Mycoplasmoidaceae bacterium]